MARAETAGADRVGKVAERAGRALGWLVRSATVRSLPGAVGALVACVGLGEIYHPLQWIAAGAFLLLLDRKVGP